MPTIPTAAHPPRSPLATYRLQLNLNFTFTHAAAIVPYLRDLGISDLYSSPILQARPGSLHGYDISDHGRLNEELGGDEAYEGLTRVLHEHGIGCLLDIVPNHMGIGEPTNAWWMDVLENGPSSSFASFFDIDWKPLKPELADRVLLPVLGDQFGEILERGELRLEYEGGRFLIRYHEHVFPVSPRSSSLVLRAAVDVMAAHCADDDPDIVELQSIVTALENLPSRGQTDEASIAERRRESFVSRRRLRDLHASSEGFRVALSRTLDQFNGTVGDPHSFDNLERVLEDQPYRLAYWRVAVEEINYRRFFDVNDLAAVRVERGEVFDATHRLVLRLVSEGKVHGLRVDHPDGLFNPLRYLRTLQEQVSRHAGEESAYVVVEKILTGDEKLPDWPVAGTVGYDFLNRLNGIFVARENVAEMTRVYRGFVGDRVDFPRLAYEKRKFILRVALASELNVLAFLINRLSERNRRFRDFTLGALTDALREIIACFPVYRTYIDAERGFVEPLDARHVEDAVRTAIRRNRATSPTVFNFVRDILLLRWPDDLDQDDRAEHALFVMKFQQLTGPVMAKGVEDTAFYIYNRLVSLNEVGGEPDRFGLSVDELHMWLRDRSSRWPNALNTTTTHDTKRSEDVRARINVLSEMPSVWEERVERWRGMNAAAGTDIEGEMVPGPNKEYLIYQTLVGAWPLEDEDPSVLADFRERMVRYMEKAAREAKVNTSWITPNEAYDEALADFVRRILTPGATGSSEFLDDLRGFAREVSVHGMHNSLAQLIIKLCAPGVPDIYQGQELWDYSLVDPDNRRTVDYERRERMLTELKTKIRDGALEELARETTREWRDGRIKMYVTHLGLALRRARPDLFRNGEYVPLHSAGPASRHVFAFARVDGRSCAVVAVPRLTWTLGSMLGPLSDPASWADTRIVLPERIGGPLLERFTGRKVAVEAGGEVQVGSLFSGFPVALLTNERGA